MARPFSFQSEQRNVASNKAAVPLSPIRRRVRRMQWVVAIGLMLFVFIYEIGISPWIQAQLGDGYHIATDIAIYGIVGPLLAYVSLHFFDRWVEERETSELQARLLEQARQRAQASTTLSDDALQTLFAASVLISSLKSSNPELTSEAKIDLARTEESLGHAIQQIRSHLEQ